MSENTRRKFLQSTAASVAALAQAQTATRKKTIGIQVGAISFLDEGVDPVLDIFQRDASVNTLFVATFTYGRGIAGRQVPGGPLPDHGKQEYDTNFHGGSYTAIHPQFYRNTVLKDFRAPDHGDYDVLASVLPSAKKRGMKTICWYEDVWRNDVPNVSKLAEKDLHGRTAGTMCFNNPDHRGFLVGLTQDYVKSYDIDGVMWGSERQGAFSNALGAAHGGKSRDH